MKRRLWSRLILHFWASAIDDELSKYAHLDETSDPNPVATLQAAFEHTLNATKEHNWQGTTTACGAQLYYRPMAGSEHGRLFPVLYVTNLGDCQILVYRPRDKKVIYKTTEQWHWFDCPRQLGTNSPDTPKENAVMAVVDLEVGDVVLAMSDGVIDNLWEHEITEAVLNSVRDWESGHGTTKDGKDRTGGRNGGMSAVAQEIVAAAKKVAMDPFAESPYMEHAIEEGLASEGGE